MKPPEKNPALQEDGHGLNLIRGSKAVEISEAVASEPPIPSMNFKKFTYNSFIRPYSIPCVAK